MRLGSWVTNHVGMKVKLRLTCLSVCVTEPAAMGIGCYETVYNFIQILDLLKPNFEKSNGRMRKNGGFPQTFPVDYLGNGLSHNDETQATGAHRQYFYRYLCFRRSRDGGTQSPTISGNSLLGKRRAVAGSPLTINLNFFTGNVE